jgi:NADP-dependent 3-hydroxy acid dehydrogenase YdfG
MEPGPGEKVALVTDANKEIGAAIAAELAREGMHLCPGARDSDGISRVADVPAARAI